MIPLIQASDYATCSAVQDAPDTVGSNVIPIGSVGGYFPSPVYLGPPDLCISPPDPARCMVEGGTGADVTATCHIWTTGGPTGIMTTRCNVAPSTTVTPVKISNAPEPPKTQVAGRAIPAAGQVPGATIQSPIHANLATIVLVAGGLLVALYIISHLK